MATAHDRILIVENDPVISDLIGRQALQAAGFEVCFAHNVAEGIASAVQVNPEVIIANITLPGLSGKDLLVALSAQGVSAPVIILAKKGQEAALIQTFRLGAADFLLWPVREPEVISVVERLLRQAHQRRERERLTDKLQQANNELQARVRELTTIYAIGKGLTSVTDQAGLIAKILDGAAVVTQADLGWFLLRGEGSQAFWLAAQRDLPAELAAQPGPPLDDGIYSLAVTSGELVSFYGEPLKHFKVSNLGQSILIAPVKLRKQVAGLLVMMRKLPQPFAPSEQHLLEAVADYASVSLVNARLFKAAGERNRSLQAQLESSQLAEKIHREVLQVIKNELEAPLERSRASLERISRETPGWSTERQQCLDEMRGQIERLQTITAAVAGSAPQEPSANLKDLVQQSIERLQKYASQRELSLLSEIPVEPIAFAGRPDTLARVLDGLVSNAIKVSKSGGTITIKVEKTRAQEGHLVICDCGPGFDPRQVPHLFEQPSALPENNQRSFAGIGIRLPLIQEIVTGLHGKIWVESKPGRGASFHLTLPLQNSNSLPG